MKQTTQCVSIYVCVRLENQSAANGSSLDEEIAQKKTQDDVENVNWHE